MTSTAAKTMSTQESRAAKVNANKPVTFSIGDTTNPATAADSKYATKAKAERAGTVSFDLPTSKSAAAPTSAYAPTDIVQQVCGNFGRWQLRTILLIFLCKIPSAWFMACIIYTAPTPRKGDYFCRPPAQMNVSGAGPHGRATAPAWVRMPSPVSDERGTDRRFYMDACNIYEERLQLDFAANHANYSNPFEEPNVVQLPNGSLSLTVNVLPCDHFEHNSDYISLVSQFDLVCSRQLLISMTQSFHGLGAFLGALLVQHALKHVSPHYLMFVGMLFQIFCGCITGLVTNFQLHIYFRCLTSIACTVMMSAGQVILMDITAGRAKTIVTTLSELFWGIGLILLPGISIFFDSWSYLYVAISSSVVILVFMHKWIADSPRWLLRHNKLDRALKQLLNSAAFNNRSIPLDLDSKLASYAKQLQQMDADAPRYWSIWDKSTERKYIYCMHGVWVGAIILHNVMLLMIRSLGMEYIHVNTACVGFSEILGIFLGLYFILYTRRRWLWCGQLMIVAGTVTYLIWLVPSSLKSSRRVAIEMLFWMFLKFANAVTFAVLATCTGEIVSPEKRALLMFSVLIHSRFWLIFGPSISVTMQIHNLIPITVLTSLALATGILLCFLDRSFRNTEQPRIAKVPTPNTYRRNSSLELLRRASTSTVGSSSGYTNSGFYENDLTISISDLWLVNTQFETIMEQDVSASESEATECEQKVEEKPKC
ncbi:solute carrier family 22 member 3 [Rhagoletis pomonella]|uniref:solute carrier family 22 member 3 n=1 Tax=Rhagoletis pomonella TaxID=28610 RepID=UPI001784C317|nr:solute carrier family 22 member 3 [Rhagoletis pomonella]